ncbi:hypothetical protein EGT07_23665 [Herbaspirillum sp. HC18]|nr:hypothetical protein EGT07_23665 [Herbaspirillum sp. HC18]
MKWETFSLGVDSIDANIDPGMCVWPGADHRIDICNYSIVTGKIGMSAFIRATLFVCLGMIAACTQARVYQHVDPVTGAVTYSNFPARGQEPEEVDAAPDRPAHHPNAPKAASRNAAPSAGAPANFPRVAAATQKERDTDRRKILNDELQSEQVALADAIARKAADDTVQRHKANIAALQREISNIK